MPEEDTASNLSNDETLVNEIADKRLETNERQLIKKQLCTTCKTLTLSVNRFIIQSTPSEDNRLDVSNFPLHSSTSTYRLGQLKQIRDRASLGCPFCSLVSKSIQNPQQNGERRPDFPANLQDAVCHANWEVDGRDIIQTKKASTGQARESGSVKGRTRRIHLRWEDERLQDAYLVFVAPEKYSTTTSDANRVWGKESLFLGRKINAGGDNQALVKSWFDLCQKKHQGPCIARNVKSSRAFLEMISHSYFGVIDVLNMQLVDLPFSATPSWGMDHGSFDEDHSSSSSPSDFGRHRDRGYRHVPHRRKRDVLGVWHAPYLALSYVWGKTPSYTATRENIMLLRTHGGLEKVLSHLPQVIKDAMDLVRRLGLQYIWIDALCIVQNSPRSWKLNAYNMDLIYGNASLTICAADGDDASVGLRAMRAGQHNNDQMKEDCAPGVSLMVTRPPEMYIRASKWNTRAWTFQERMLSNRCLIFTEGRVYFQCRSTGMSEDIYADREGAGWSLDFVDAPMQMFRQLSSKAIWVYIKSVELYTSRELTQPKDVLAAFSGMTNLMEQRMRSPFVFGLPSSHFDLALLWEPKGPVKRRDTHDNKGTEDYRSMEFPSWSWSGWIGAPTSYRDDMIGGCLDNVSQWLNRYTWIKWYVRDGHGDLRPLWDRELSKIDRSKEKRWRGYGSSRSYWKGEPVQRETEEDRMRHEDSRRERELKSYKEKNRAVVVFEDRDYARGRDDEESPRRRDERHSYDEDYPRRRAARDSYDEETFHRPRNDYELSPDARHKGGYEADRPRTGLPPAPTHTSDFFEMFFEQDHEVNPDGVGSSRKFQITLRDYPYRVVIADFVSKPDSFEFPLMPILQFWTWHTFLYLQRAPDSRDAAGKVVSGDGLVRCHVADDVGDWCGSIVLDEEWVKTKSSAKHEFIAISFAKNFTQKECSLWTYYIPKEREQSEWDLFFVLLIERKDEKWERVGVGKVFKAAFAKAKWKEIMLG